MREAVVILGAVRTPVGKFGRAFRDVAATRLGALVIDEALRRASIDPREVDEVIMGNVLSAGLGQNPARQAAIHAGLPAAVSAYTVNKVCGSGLKAVMLAAQAVRADDAAIVVAGGMECMSGAPHLIRGARWGVKLGDLQVIDAMISDGLCDAFHRYHMGITGERVAEKYGVTREEADRFALASHQKAVSAIRQGSFDKEVLPVRVGDIVVTSDECPREDTSYERLSNLKPVFKNDGILTAGNSSQLSDGAAALVITSARKARERGITPLARIVDYASGGVAPEDIMEAPIPVVRSLLGKTAITMDDIDLVECNEAYATSTLVIARELGIDLQKLNINGGAVALGHPIGCSGARILLTLLYALHHHGLKRGLATLCIGGGNAVAMIIERL